MHRQPVLPPGPFAFGFEIARQADPVETLGRIQFTDLADGRFDLVVEIVGFDKGVDVDRVHEVFGPVGGNFPGLFQGHPGTDEWATEDGAEKRQAVTAWSGRRQQGLGVVRVGRGVALGIHCPALGNRLSVHAHRVDLAPTGDGAGHVEYHRMPVASGSSPGQGVVGHCGAAAAVGSHRGRTGAGRGVADHSLGRGHHRVDLGGSEVLAGLHGHGSRADLFCLVDRHLHRAGGRHVAQPLSAVEHRHGRSVTLGQDRCPGVDAPRLHLVEIAGQGAGAV